MVRNHDGGNLLACRTPNTPNPVKSDSRAHHGKKKNSVGEQSLTIVIRENED